MYAYDEGKI
jgi:hypothetical protein